MMLPFLKQFHEIVTNSATASNDLSTIYGPGLVSKKDECATFIISSVDGVGMLFSHDHSEVVPIPIEIKSRNSARTFHTETERIRISNWQLRFEDVMQRLCCMTLVRGTNFLHNFPHRRAVDVTFYSKIASRTHMKESSCYIMHMHLSK